MKSKKNPRPKIHKAIKRYVKENIRETISRLKYNLECLERDIIEDIYIAFAHEIDNTIEEAYNEGIEHGRELEREEQ